MAALVIGNAVLLDQRDEIPGGVALQRGDAEMRVGRKKIGRLDEAVGKIAAPAAGYKDFLPNLLLPSRMSTRLPRLPAVMAHIKPEAPPPITTTSKGVNSGYSVRRLEAVDRGAMMNETSVPLLFATVKIINHLFSI